MSTFSAHHYNALAKEIREHFPTAWGIETDINSSAELRQREKANLQRATMADFALSLCKRFQEDNPRFDPIKFLDACSPNTDLYPLSELWEGDQLA